MRNVGLTWTTADVPHTDKTWLPSVQNRLSSTSVHVRLVIVVAWAMIEGVHVGRLRTLEERGVENPFDALALREQYLLKAALGAFLMAAFSFEHSLFAMVCSLLAPSPLAFFPLLHTTRVWDVTSARGF